MSDSDTPDPRTAPTTMGAFAQRLMARWHTTPVTTTVQRAVSARPAAGIGQSASAQTLVQRITARTQPLTAWNAKATSTETAIESFTDTVVQRFPDYGAKYLPRTEETESPPSKEVDMVFSGGRSGGAAASTPQAQSSTFDPDSLPSVPPEVMARHLKNRQAAKPATPAAPVQRKATPPDPKLVRPRSRVDYFGSTAAPTPIAPVNTTPATTETIQAKADESKVTDSTANAPAAPEVLPDTPPIEQPTFRTRPRAGFQTIPTKNMSAPPGEGSKDIPFVPLQLKAEPEAPAPAAPSADAPSSPTTDTPIQRVADDENGNDDPPPSNDVPPEGPPPPPAPVLPTEPLQRVAVEPSEPQPAVDMPLRQHPDEPSESPPSETTAVPPVQRQTDAPRAQPESPIQRQASTSAPSAPVTLPPLSSAVPAKVVRRKMAVPAPEQVRKPAGYNSPTSTPSVSPVQRQVADTASALPVSSSNAERPSPSSAPSVAADIEPQRDIPQRNDMPLVAVPVVASSQADAPIQRVVDTDAATPTGTPIAITADTATTVPIVAPSITSDVPLQRRAVEPSAPNGEGEPVAPSVSVDSTNASEPPVQRMATDAAPPVHTDNPTISVSAQPASVATPTRADMPLREADSTTAPIQRQVEESSTRPDGTTEGSRVASGTVEPSVITPPIQRRADSTSTTINRAQEPSITQQVESSLSATPIQRISESAPVTSAPPVDNSPSPTATPGMPIQRTAAVEGDAVAKSSEPSTTASYVNEGQNNEGATPPLQRQVDSTGVGERATVSVEAPSESPTGLNRVDMPLRVAEDTAAISTTDAPIQRQALDTNNASPTTATGISASSAPLQRQAPENTPSAPAAAQGTSVPSTPIQRQAAEAPISTPSTAKNSLPANAPIQRQVADSTTSALTATNTVSSVAAPIQRQAVNETSSTPAVTNGVPTSNTPIQQQASDTTPATPIIVESTSASSDPIQRQTENVATAVPTSASGTPTSITPNAETPASVAPSPSIETPIQRQASERVSITAPATPSAVDMPLRALDSANDTTPIQRQVEESASPSNAASVETVISGTESDAPIQRQVFEQANSAGTASVTETPSQSVSQSTTPTITAPIQRQVNESTPTTNVVASTPTTVESVTSDAPIQRVSAEPPTRNVERDREEMPLRLNDTPSTPTTQTPVQLQADSTTTPARETMADNGQPTAASSIAIQRQANPNQATTTPQTANASTAVEASTVPGAQPAIVTSAPSATFDAPIQRVAVEAENEATASANNDTSLRITASPHPTAGDTVEMPLRLNDTPSISDTGTIQRAIDDTASEFIAQAQNPAVVSDQPSTPQGANVSSGAGASTAISGTPPVQRKADESAVPDATREVTQGSVNRSPANEQIEMPLRTSAAPTGISSLASGSETAGSNNSPASSVANAPIQRVAAETQGNDTATQPTAAAPQTSSLPLQRAATSSQAHEAAIQRVAVQPALDTAPVQVQATPSSTEPLSRADMPLRESDTSSNGTIQRQADDTLSLPSDTQNNGNSPTLQGEVSTSGPSSEVDSGSTTAASANPIQRVADDTAVADNSLPLDTPVRVTPSVASPNAPEMPLRENVPIQRQVAETNAPTGLDNATSVGGTSSASTASSASGATSDAGTQHPASVAPIQRRAIDGANTADAPLVTAEPQPRVNGTATPVEMPLRAIPTDAPIQRRADDNAEMPSSSTPIIDAGTSVTATSAPTASPVVGSTDTAPIQRKTAANEGDTPIQRQSDTDTAPTVTATPPIQTATPLEMPLRASDTSSPATSTIQRQADDAPESFGSDASVSNSVSATPGTIQRVATPASNESETPTIPVRVAPPHPETIQRKAMPLRAAPLESSVTPSVETKSSTPLETSALPVQRKVDSASPSVAVEGHGYTTPTVVQRMSAAPVRTLNRTTARAVQRKADTNGSEPASRPLRVTVARSTVQRATALPLALAGTTPAGMPEPTIQRAVSTPSGNDSVYTTESAPVARVSPTIQRQASSPLPRTLRHLSQDGAAPTTLSNNWEALPIQRQSESSPAARDGMPLAAPATLLTSPSTPATEQMDLVIQRRDVSDTTSTTTSSTTNEQVNDEPSESDAQRALETLARQIYPLLKQMLQRDRERHRGF